MCQRKLPSIGSDKSNVEHRYIQLDIEQKVICIDVASVKNSFTGKLEISGQLDSNSKIAKCQVQLEDGQLIDADILASRSSKRGPAISLVQIPVGYHQLFLAFSSGVQISLFLIVHPLKCYLPDVEKPERALTLQLYALQNERNWGIGSYTDLGDLLRQASGHYNYIGINPLHALPPLVPEAASPYAPDSRILLNEIYIDVEAAVRNFCEKDVIDRVAAVSVSPQIKRLRCEPLVKYRDIYAIKMRYLELAFRSLSQNPYQFRKISSGLEKFISGSNPLVVRAIVERARRRNWRSLGDVAFRCLFEFFLQWLCWEQLSEAQRKSSCGIYTDLAIGSAIGGTDNIISGSLFDTTRSLGAPPDSFCIDGQKWNVAPLNIKVLQATGYHYFRIILEQNMMVDGALRIDHIIGLMRRFTMDMKEQPISGRAENIPIKEFLAVLAIESHRKRCLVIGEDLGAVPIGLREIMVERNVLGCVIYLLEKEKFGFLSIEDARRKAGFFAFNTHDCIPMCGYFLGRDLEINQSLNRDEISDEQAEIMARNDLQYALFTEHGLEVNSQKDRVQALNNLAVAYGGRINAFSLDDILGETEPVNIPGTDREFPNWRRKYRRPATEVDFTMELF